jgi:hypothetical protein
LTVHYADGRTDSTLVPIAAWVREIGGRFPSMSSSQIDGVPGQDIVIGTDNSPASFTAYTVIAARNRELITVPAPISQGWFIGGFDAGGGIGFTCHGATLVALVSAADQHHGRGDGFYTTTHTRYVWVNGAWAELDRHVTHGRFSAQFWNCRGLVKGT